MLGSIVEVATGFLNFLAGIGAGIKALASGDVFGALRSVKKGFDDLFDVSPVENFKKVYDEVVNGTSKPLFGGGGFNFNLSDNFSVRLQTMFNYTFNDVFDGYPWSNGVHKRNKNSDAFMYHSLGVVYHFGAGAGAARRPSAIAVDSSTDFVTERPFIAWNFPRAIDVAKPNLPSAPPLT